MLRIAPDTVPPGGPPAPPHLAPALFDALGALAAAAGDGTLRVTLETGDGRTLELTAGPSARPPAPSEEPPAAPPPPWLPTDFQRRLLKALEGRALHTDDLAQALGIDRRNVFRKPRGIGELRERGLVALHPRLGYYRPSAAPPEVVRALAAQAEFDPPVR